MRLRSKIAWDAFVINELKFKDSKKVLITFTLMFHMHTITHKAEKKRMELSIAYCQRNGLPLVHDLIISCGYLSSRIPREMNGAFLARCYTKCCTAIVAKESGIENELGGSLRIFKMTNPSQWPTCMELILSEPYNKFEKAEILVVQSIKNCIYYNTICFRICSYAPSYRKTKFA
ncbi:hypothetical protein EGR_09778 [Echinococcus granulosus]|uniref:Uncharacterized protein n=1 Tax=Echinococcus granulosus TaxID=6210 RepID=W6UA72_ECHGR|nr:hypothetical protein EGR_09778 [Echinococcus granulosus]EUB55372.1 hypothetical protein EGR_09778 [Echinococcus granulosus]